MHSWTLWHPRYVIHPPDEDVPTHTKKYECDLFCCSVVAVWLWESRGPWSLEGNGDIEVKTKCRNSWSCTTTLPQEQKQHPGYSELTSRRDPTFPNTVCSHRANSSHRPPVGLLHWRAAYSHFDFFTFYFYCSSFFRYFLVIFVSILADVIKDVT